MIGQQVPVSRRKSPAANTPVAMGRLAALIRRKAELDETIDREEARPAPCALTLQTLKRRRLALKQDMRRLRESRMKSFSDRV